MSLERRGTLEALIAADGSDLTRRYSAAAQDMPPATPVRGPEIGMVMLRGRIGGGGALFNLGEACVTRATVRLDDGLVGHAVVLGREPDKARMVAHLDALSQTVAWADRIEREFVGPALEAREQAVRRSADEAEATRVDFFTLARGED